MVDNEKRYIILPKRLPVEMREMLQTARPNKDSRQKQIHDFTSTRQQQAGYKQVVEYLSQSEHAYSVQGVDEPVTGARLLRMSEERAKEMRNELKDAEIVEDREIKLIQPILGDGILDNKDTLDDEDTWHLEAINQDSWRRNALPGKRTPRGNGVTVLVLDTGVDGSHQDLAGKVDEAVRFDSLNNKAHLLTPSSNNDNNGHGTHVAGLICGEKTGVAPGAKIIDGRLLDYGNGTLSDFIYALNWAARNPDIQIINLSAGLMGYLPELHTVVDAVRLAGVFISVAIGNEGRGKTRSPGNYSDVFSVGASNEHERVAWFSGGGNLTALSHLYTCPDLVAPGSNIWSCKPGGGYVKQSGTSMAAAVVSGVACLMMERYPTIRVVELEEELLSSCKPLGQPAERQGAGMIQVDPAYRKRSR